MIEKESQSLMDILLRLMPELKVIRKNRADPKMANLLYNRIWSQEQHRVSNKLFRRPDDVKTGEVQKLAEDGLIEIKGENIEITEKGAQVVKQMILGDARSSFDDDGSPVEYLKAIASLAPSRMSKRAKRASSETMKPVGSNWYTAAQQPATCSTCCQRKSNGDA